MPTFVLPREGQTSHIIGAIGQLRPPTSWTIAVRVLGDLGYEGEAATVAAAVNKPADGEPSDGLRRVILCPWRISAITAALVRAGRPRRLHTHAIPLVAQPNSTIVPPLRCVSGQLISG